MTVRSGASLRDAMTSLKRSGVGLVIVLDDEGKVVGVLSDGDIRKVLLDSEDMEAVVDTCMNRDFVSVPEGTPKERTLKLLDSRIRAIPVIDSAGCFVDVVGPGYLGPRTSPYARARAPARISLAGGGTDFTGYFMHHAATCLSCTVAKYSHALVRKREDSQIRIFSRDARQAQTYSCLSDIDYGGPLDLVKAGIKLMQPGFGFDLEVGCDFPPGSGLGGSAAVLASVIACFNEFREQQLDSYAIAEHAFEAERLELKIAGGWQDQYSTVFGGFNVIELNQEQNVVMPLRLPSQTLLELEERLILCHTGVPHRGMEIQQTHADRNPNDNEWKSAGQALREITETMKSRLLRGQLDGFGRLLSESWEVKKGLEGRVTNPELDTIYTAGCEAGAEGGRLLGTGGGGSFLFYLHPFRRYQVTARLELLGTRVESLVLDHNGLQSWIAHH